MYICVRTYDVPNLLSHLVSKHSLINPLLFDRHSAPVLLIKILSLLWNPISHLFSYQVLSIGKLCTYRNVLFQLALIFDATGFLTSRTIILETFLQDV